MQNVAILHYNANTVADFGKNLTFAAKAPQPASLFVYQCQAVSPAGMEYP